MVAFHELCIRPTLIARGKKAFKKKPTGRFRNREPSLSAYLRTHALNEGPADGRGSINILEKICFSPIC